MKTWECVKISNHVDVGSTIGQWQKNGWQLHTYQVTGRDIWMNYLLQFTIEKGAKNCKTIVKSPS